MMLWLIIGKYLFLASYQSRCSSISECIDPLAVCSLGVCDCSDTMVYDAAVDRCKVIHSEMCSTTSQCVTYADCISRECVCQNGYINTTTGICKGEGIQYYYMKN